RRRTADRCSDYCKRLDWQSSKEIFCILDLQKWSSQMCREKTRIGRGSNRGLCGDFAFGQSVDNARNFFDKIKLIPELKGANSRASRFYKRTEAKRIMK